MFDIKITCWFYVTGGLRTTLYARNQKPHRIYGPSEQRWFTTGALSLEEWHMDGLAHRSNGPAIRTWYFGDSILAREEWFLREKYHRFGGPAYQYWGEDGMLIDRSYWVYGIEITEEIQEWANTTGIKDIMAMTPEEITMFKLTWGNNV